MSKRLHGSQDGGVMPFVILSVVGLFGMAAIAVDVGMMYFARQRAQNVMDSAVLAAAKDLPRTDANEATIRQHINSVINASNKSGNSVINATVTFPTSVTEEDGTVTATKDTAVRVDGYVNAPMTFSPVVGYRPTSVDGSANTFSVPAHATAMNRVLTGYNQFGSAVSDNAGDYGTKGFPIAPFGVIGDDENSSIEGVARISKLLTSAMDSQTPLPNQWQTDDKRIYLKAPKWQGSTMTSPGNFSPLAIGKNGGNNYKANIAQLANVSIHIGDILNTETGNLVGPTREGVTNRLDSSNTLFTHNFTSYEQWFFGDSSKAIDSNAGTATVNGVAHNYYQDPHRQELTDAHVVLVPVITDPSKNGKAQVTILAIAAFYVDSVPTDSTDNAVYGRFIGFIDTRGTMGGGVGAGGFSYGAFVG